MPDPATTVSALQMDVLPPSVRPVALITGASRGIGAATAKELARRGYTLVLAARSEPELREIARELTSTGTCCHIVPTDLRRREDVEKLARTALAQFGAV